MTVPPLRRSISLLSLAWAAALGLASACRDQGGRPSEEAPASASSSERTVASPSPEERGPSGRELVQRLECARCHQGLGEEARVARDKSCVDCHREIGAGSFKAAPDLLASWKPRVMHLRFTPSLSGVGRLLKASWVERYLTRPFPLRPALAMRMPRLSLDERDARAIASYLAELGSRESIGDPVAPRAGAIERGRALFSDKGCARCHVFTGSGTTAPREIDPGKALEDRALAPDLRFARDRLERDRVAPYLMDPQRIKPGAAMPKPDLTEDEARDLAAFVLDAPLAPDPPKPPMPPRLPVLERPVGYDEVATKVLHKICWHCHAQPDFARGDGGAGNTGGFGFAPRGLDLSSYEAIAAGYLDDHGERTSLFSARDGGPILVEALLARHREERGEIGAVRGMPLGLPPLSAEDIQLVESWLAQGHPR